MRDVCVRELSQLYRVVFQQWMDGQSRDNSSSTKCSSDNFQKMYDNIEIELESCQ